ncbi:hypothetical protein QVD17_11483 [Tagetes erecta]|uniref:DUF7138 domain-containing protein n=1 Tax=Tagetes erecta TaxID=13708 RepID=A0AAD8KUF1_TARER|nr:hypothetical protein QVD17_11483 [Tagetes erecta]
MVQIDAGVEFPVILYNGERQVDLGNIEIHPTTDFHTFRTILKQMTGISHNNLTSYLVESQTSETQSDRRKLLITSKTDFNVLMREKNAYFLVVLKQSRRERRRRRMNNPRPWLELSTADLFDYHYNNNNLRTQMDESRIKVEIWLHGLHMQRMNDMNNVNMMHNFNNYEYDHSHVNGNFANVTEEYIPLVERSVNRGTCEDCDRANERGLKPEFHMCVYDDVVEGFFRSPAGPISRPLTMIVV